MFDLPTLPTWDGLHPGISHFPIALLVMAPLVVLAALLSPARRRSLLGLALVCFAGGTLAVYLSAATGDAAKELAPKTAEVTAAIETHESAGSAVRAVSTALTLLLGALLYAPGRLRRPLAESTFRSLALLFLLLCFAAALPLYNAAHSGGVLVHQLGVHARL